MVIFAEVTEKWEQVH